MAEAAGGPLLCEIMRTNGITLQVKILFRPRNPCMPDTHLSTHVLQE
jgi:hypothetical protein